VNVDTATIDNIDTAKRTELQALAVVRFGKGAAAWTGRATNVELREALRSGEPPARVATPTATNGTDLASMIAGAVAPLLAGQVNEERVNEIVEEHLSSYRGAVDEERVRQLVAEELEAHPPIRITLPTGITIDASHQHRHFADLATLVGRGRHVWLVGPAGTGKSEAALSLASQMGVRKALVPMHEDVTPSRLLGFRSPVNGEWVPGELEGVLTEGGIAILDEVDRARSGVPVALNAVLAQRKFTVRGETRNIHPNAKVVCCSNTLHGGTAEYAAARQQDGAFKDRFYILDWPADTDLELRLAGADQREWVEFCWQLRDLVNELGITSGRVSPRTMIQGAQDLRDGLNRERVADWLIWNKFAQSDARKLKDALQRRAA
jgi:hypothetical protein